MHLIDREMGTKFFEVIEAACQVKNWEFGYKLFFLRILIQKILYFIMEFSARTFNFPEQENAFER